MKITVIATGFGRAGRARPVSAAGADAGRHDAHTPSTRASRRRAPVAGAGDRRARLSIAGRPPLDLPLRGRRRGAPLPRRRSRAGSATARLPRTTPSRDADGADFDLSSTFDVPAFLRRQEG